MSRIARLPVRLVYAAAVLGSLAFGARQAFAATGPAEAARSWCPFPECVMQGFRCVCY
jgi:hypothetical protein